jgi:hypothetical protein
VSYVDIYDRMKVEVPAGEIDGMKITKFEVVYPDKWTDAHEKRMKEGSGDLVSPLQLARMSFNEGRAPYPGWYTRLSEGDQVWMSDTTHERRDHIEPVQEIVSAKARRVVINGLGIGMVLSAALSYDFVEHVDVVEIDQRVINLVGPHYLKDPRVRIHHADAVKQMKAWPANARWDVGWTDIWPNICADNLEEMKSFTDFYGPRCGFHGNWAEDIAKRSVWDNQYTEKSYMKFLTEADKEQFEEEDEQNYYDDEEDDDDED